MADEVEKKNTWKTLLDLPDECFKDKPLTVKEQAKLAETWRKCVIEPVLRLTAPQVITFTRPRPSLAEQFAKQLAEQKRLLSKTLKSVKQLKRKRRVDPAEIEAGVPRGRPPYDRIPIIAAAEELIKGGVNRSQKEFVGKVRSRLEVQNKKLEPQDRKAVPGDTVLKAACAPIYKREKSKK
jgi:hypothetical protein